MHIVLHRIASIAFISCLVSVSVLAEDTAPKEVVCIGDSITRGAGIKNPRADTYPARLQKLLGEGYRVTNYGLNSATLTRKGRPNLWGHLKIIQEKDPDIVVISLGTNDTCGGKRGCWDHKADFPGDYRDFLDIVLAYPSKPRVWICAPPPMVIDAPGLSEERKRGLEERQPRLQELIAIIRKLAREKKVGFIDLNTPLADRQDCFNPKDGVHPNEKGCEAIAELVHAELKKAVAEARENP